ncbi:MAG TPA: glycoside hydrolase family 3 C-terminal domain-containing protein [Candidatus Acidoferrales bacterium]|nr:glycoside hydrolase family 3 C-terminal domain-containing protein [Candidatus Acidoferrales bacterium]
MDGDDNYDRVQVEKNRDRRPNLFRHPAAWPLTVFLLALLCVAAVSTRAPLAASSADPDARAREIVRQMTLAEKITELHGIRDANHYRYVPPIPRLGIPALRVTNGPAGVGPGGTGPQAPATALPAPIALAATWDVVAAREYGRIEGSEARDLGNDLIEAPTINIVRVPQNGRTFEGYGEDPYLSGQLAVANVEGIQSQHEIANVKHFDANNQETDRFVINEIIGHRALNEIYLPAFEAAVREGHAASVMCAYPQINGTFSCQNRLLMTDVLEKEWGFDGFITSDFGAVHSTVPSAEAGLDLEMPTGIYFGAALQAAVTSGQVPVSLLDQKLVRRFRTMIRFGLFDQPPTRQPIPARKNGAVARQLAEEGMVLLKNKDGTLPLDTSRLKTLALIGPYAAKVITGGGGSSHVVPLYVVDPVEGIQARIGSKVRVELADGGNLAQAVALARTADAAVVMVGQMNTEGRDHPLALGDGQDELVSAIAAVNKHTIVVIKSGSAVLMPWASQVESILEAWYPGEEDGNAVAAVLFGDVNPSGKLPLTFPVSVSDTFAANPVQYPGVDKVVRYTEGVFVGYRYYDAKGMQPLFPFGFGLSYTKFAYKDLRIAPERLPVSGKPRVHVEIKVQNVGSRTGTEIVQLYVGIPSTTAVPEPPKQLKGFVRVTLRPGQTSPVHLDLDPRSFSYWDVAASHWAILPGTYQILIGSSSRDIRLRGAVRITK